LTQSRDGKSNKKGNNPNPKKPGGKEKKVKGGGGPISIGDQPKKLGKCC